MIRRRLDAELHGSDGFTSVSRVVAFAAIGLATIGALHLGVQTWYADRIIPGVSVAGMQLGGLSRDEARKLIIAKTKAYKVNLSVAGKPYELKAETLGATFDVEATLAAAYATGRDNWLPLVAPTQVPLSYTLSRTKLVELADDISGEVGVAPVDATVKVLGDSVQPVADKSGWTVDRLGLVRLIESDIAAPADKLLTLKAREQPADILAPATAPAIDTAKRLMSATITLTYQDKVFKPTSAQIGKWVSFAKVDVDTQPKLIAKLDAGELHGYVQTLADQLDVAPVPKKVTVENGVSKVTQEGVDGSAIDQDPIVAAMTKAIETSQPLVLGITSHPVPFKTLYANVVTLDYGRYIEISITKQHLWVWQDHAVIYESPVTTGAPAAGLGTVTGLFSIYSKQTNTFLTGVGYRLHVDYWMPFYKGYGLHDAYWRTDLFNAGKISQPFGGQDYVYMGSHGCVNMPNATAAFIYNWSTVGTPVWVHK